MRRIMYGFVGLLAGVITYIFLFVGSPTIEDVKSSLTDFHIVSSDYQEEDLRDIRGDVTSFLENGSYHVLGNKLEAYRKAEIIKYGKINPMFYYAHKKASEDESENETTLSNTSSNESDSNEEESPESNDSDAKNELPRIGGNIFTIENGITKGYYPPDRSYKDVEVTAAIFDFSETGQLPVDSKHMILSSNFGERDDPFNGKKAVHSGIDIASPEIANANVYASSHGTISIVSNDPNGYGNYVIISHNGYETLYGHLSSFSNIEVGDMVRAGELLGSVGSTGRSSGAHLHFEVRVDESMVDPMLFIEEIRKEG